MSPAPRRPRRVLVLGLDGATLDVVRPLAAAGRLPHLAAWMDAGAAAPLPSTVPPMSFPAWSSFLTGKDPGEHGVFDFTQKVPGAYRLRFVNASWRRGTTLLGAASAAGRRVLALGIPATFPPEPVDGLCVAGFDAPVSASTHPRSASDPDLYGEVAARSGPWKRPDLDESASGDDAGWHERAVRTLLERVERKADFAVEALAALARRGRPADLAAIVFAESDTVAHHYWRDHDPASPRHDPAAGAERRGAVAAVYERLDAACGRLREAFGEDALCAVVSDHGTGGAADHVVHLGGRLEECGLLVRRPRSATDALARRARDAALRWLPPRAAERVFRRARGAAARVESAARFAGHDWARTAAFSEDTNTQPGVWVNLRGREASGCVDPADYERVRDDVVAALGEWRLPGGAPVVARARRREEVYAGPCVDRAPDVVVELAEVGGYGLSLVSTPWERAGPRAATRLTGEGLAGGRGRGMNGTHRPDGLCIAHGPDAGHFAARCSNLTRVAPAVLEALGVPAPDDATSHDRDAYAYDEDEEARVAARLRALGYLE